MATEAATTDLVQAALFSDLDLGSELLTIEQDAKAGRHTGTTLERRRELVEVICERLAGGMSIRDICKLYGVGRNTVSALMQRLEAAGRLEPYKKRIAAKLGLAVEMGMDRYLEALASGAVDPDKIPVAVGIFSDKRALLEGEPTVIAEVRVLAPESINAWVDSLPRVMGEVIELPALPAAN
jgi:hypothetical protein